MEGCGIPCLRELPLSRERRTLQYGTASSRKPPNQRLEWTWPSSLPLKLRWKASPSWGFAVNQRLATPLNRSVRQLNDA